MKWKHEVERIDITDEDFTTVVGREPRTREEFMTWAMVVEKRTNDYTDLDAVYEDAQEAIDDFEKEAKDNSKQTPIGSGDTGQSA